MADWRFYGREKELARVRDFIDRRGFDAGLILGGRGIGKTELLLETQLRNPRKSMLIFELQDPALEERVQANRRLIGTIRDTLPQPVSSSIPPLDDYYTELPRERFVGLIRHLLQHNITVCLDEFHMAKPMKLEGALKLLIDRSESLSGDRPPGKLIVMGSHQQQVLDMFHGTEPLHGRAPLIARLRQWRMPTLFEMAAEQGFLQRPGRMLTLWCAFGGVPRNWRQFAREARLADFNASESDDAWRQGFLDWHRQLLQNNPRERFDSKAFIELAEPAREALLWLARRHPRGMIFPRFPDHLRELPERALERSLEMLRDHLGLVEKAGPFWTPGPYSYRICDNSTLCQISVYREMFAGTFSRRGEGKEDGSPEQALRRLQSLEGLALERMAHGWLSCQADVTWSMQGAWRPNADGDIDVMGLRGRWSDPDPVLVMGGAKRNAREHSTTTLDRQFGQFLDDIPGEDGQVLRSRAREKLLISPVFSPGQRGQHARAGFRTIDMHDMARGLGIEPVPGIPAPVPEPEPYTSPSPF